MTPQIELLQFDTPEALAQAAAAAWLREIAAAQQAGRPHTVALSGGRITQKFFQATVAQSRSLGLRLTNVHFFWADERCVAPDHADSNFKLANDLLFQPLNLPANQIHRLRGEDSPQAAVKTAESELWQIAQQDKNGRPILDLVLLGMGEDGHIASLFPNAGPEVLQCVMPFLAVGNSPKPPPMRISLSYQAIADARQVWALVSGAGKAAAFQDVQQPGGVTPLAKVVQRRPVRIFSDLPK
ncbi:MAG TPA: 6-phosphogluconolactonase [Verrucomicrobiae bacterium]